MVRMLEIPRRYMIELLNEAAAAHPSETCGVIMKDFMGNIHVIRMANVYTKPQSGFMFDRDEQLTVFQIASRTDPGIVAVYHSHPSGSLEMSANDLLSAWQQDPELVHIILATVPRREAAAYKMNDGNKPENITLVLV